MRCIYMPWFSFSEEQFYRFVTLSNERIARHRTQCITRLEKAMMDNEVCVCVFVHGMLLSVFCVLGWGRFFFSSLLASVL